MPALFSGSLIVNKTALCAACTAALLSLLETLPFDTAVVGHDAPVSRAALLADLRRRLEECPVSRP